MERVNLGRGFSSVGVELEIDSPLVDRDSIFPEFCWASLDLKPVEPDSREAD